MSSTSLVPPPPRFASASLSLSLPLSSFALKVPPPSSEQSQWWSTKEGEDDFVEISKLPVGEEEEGGGANPWAEGKEAVKATSSVDPLGVSISPMVA